MSSMKGKRCAVFSCLGLGDGLIALVLSNNLQRNGYEVDTFHPSLTGLQSFFPHLPIFSFPEKVGEYDHYFVIYEKTPWMLRVLEECPRDSLKILNPIATLKNDYPYWEVGRFQGDKPFATNLYIYCRDILKLKETVRDNGIIGKDGRKYPKRVVIHPTSSRPGKNWPREKFLELADKLKKEGYEPVFCVSPKEKAEWPEGRDFPNLAEMAQFVCESGYMVGNDSGIGHLASSFGLPTVTICRSPLAGNFWRPAWAHSEILYPPQWVPNLKGLRLRDKYWKSWISVNRVLSAWRTLQQESV